MDNASSNAVIKKGDLVAYRPLSWLDRIKILLKIRVTLRYQKVKRHDYIIGIAAEDCIKINDHPQILVRLPYVR